MYVVEHFIDPKGVDVIRDWIKSLKDRQAALRLVDRIGRLEDGAFGDCKFVRDGLWELRLAFGPGYRVYYSMVGKRIILLLCGGDKRRQDADIERALAYLQEYKRSRT